MASVPGGPVWVVGASRGIGRALADGLRGAGFTVIGFSRAGGHDFAEPGTAERCLAAHGPPAGWIHCPGDYLERPLLATGPDDWARLWRSNVESFLAGARVLLPAMAGAGGGVVLAFGAARAGGGARRRAAAYFAVKAALEECLRALALEFAPRGLRLHLILPGLIRHDSSATASQERLLPRVPAGRMGRPEDLLGLVRFLLGPESAYLTGGTFPVDGGLSLS